MLDQDEELILLIQGQPAPVAEADNHVEHRALLAAFMASADWGEVDDHAKAMILAHDAEHEAVQRRVARKRQQQMQQMMERQMMAPMAGPGQGSVPSATTNVERRTQGGPGETNGPQNGHVAKPGRAAAFSSGQNQMVGQRRARRRPSSSARWRHWRRPSLPIASRSSSCGSPTLRPSARHGSVSLNPG